MLSYDSLAQQSFAVVELFTSEGCSSCPPADALLSEIKKEADKSGQNIITLAWHVDYWNRLGWKDPFSKSQYTIRQENYSRVLPDKQMYTPQAIINGEISFTGSNRSEMKKGIDKALSIPSKYNLSVTIDSSANDTIYLKYKFSVHSPDYSLKFILTEDGLSSKVNGGENTGKLLHHDSVVRYVYSIDSPQLSGTFNLPSKVFTGKNNRRLVALVQQKLTMKIVAATMLPVGN